MGSLSLRICCFSHSFPRTDLAWGLFHKGNESLLAVVKAAHITDFRHKLRAKGFSNAIQSHNHRIFWQHGGQTVHLGTVGLDRTEMLVSWLAACCTSTFATGPLGTSVITDLASSYTSAALLCLKKVMRDVYTICGNAW